MSLFPDIGHSLSQYVLTEKIGEGGMGVVFKAWDSKLKRHAAVKIMKSMGGNQDQWIKRFLSEARVLAQFNHPITTTIYDINEEGEFPYFAMEYLDGKSLKECLLKNEIRINELLKIGITVAEGMDTIHKQGVLHRDLKPGNIFITTSHGVKIIDFGIAKWGADPDSVQTEVHQVMGSLQYCAPEVFLLERPNSATEVFSLGVTLINSLIGYSIFNGETSTEIISNIKYEEMKFDPVVEANIPQVLKDFFQLATEKDYRDRMQTMSEFAEELRNIVPLLPERFLSLKPIDIQSKKHDISVNKQKLNKTVATKRIKKPAKKKDIIDKKSPFSFSLFSFKVLGPVTVCALLLFGVMKRQRSEQGTEVKREVASVEKTQEKKRKPYLFFLWKIRQEFVGQKRNQGIRYVEDLRVTLDKAYEEGLDLSGIEKDELPKLLWSVKNEKHKISKELLAEIEKNLEKQRKEKAIQ